jgi:hypothetical protein
MDGLIKQMIFYEYANGLHRKDAAGQDEASLPGSEQVALISGAARRVRPIWQIEGLYARKRCVMLHSLIIA